MLDTYSLSTRSDLIALFPYSLANAEKTEKDDGNGEDAAGEEEAGNNDEDVKEDEGSVQGSSRPSIATASEGTRTVADESDEDKQLAWEVLEVAKKIYRDHQSPEADLPLSNVHSRLADISRFDGHYREAIKDYTESLRLRQAALPATSRDLADVLYNMGVCHVYLGNEEGEVKRVELREAISKYTAARDILKKRSEEESTPTSEKEDLKSIVEDLTEELETLEQDLQQEGSSSSSSSQLPTTTIGFGNPSGSNQAPVPSAISTSGGSAQSSSNGGAMMLQGRSKKKHPELSKTLTSNENDNPEAKRSRLE